MSAMRSICIAYILQIEAKYIIQLIIILSFMYCDRLCRSYIIYLFDSIDWTLICFVIGNSGRIKEHVSKVEGKLVLVFFMC